MVRERYHGVSILQAHQDKWTPEPNTGCYIWLGGMAGTRGKRPSLRLGGRKDGKNRYIARLVCEETNGPPPFAKAEAAHKPNIGCVGSLCVNGDHTYWATRSQNEFDKPLELRRAAFKTNHPSWK